MDEKENQQQYPEALVVSTTPKRHLIPVYVNKKDVFSSDVYDTIESVLASLEHKLYLFYVSDGYPTAYSIAEVGEFYVEFLAYTAGPMNGSIVSFSLFYRGKARRVEVWRSTKTGCWCCTRRMLKQETIDWAKIERIIEAEETRTLSREKTTEVPKKKQEGGGCVIV